MIERRGSQRTPRSPSFNAEIAEGGGNGIESVAAADDQRSALLAGSSLTARRLASPLRASLNSAFFCVEHSAPSRDLRERVRNGLPTNSVGLVECRRIGTLVEQHNGQRCSPRLRHGPAPARRASPLRASPTLPFSALRTRRPRATSANERWSNLPTGTRTDPSGRRTDAWRSAMVIVAHRGKVRGGCGTHLARPASGAEPSTCWESRRC